MDHTDLKLLLQKGDARFWEALESATKEAVDFDEIFRLSMLRKRAHARGLSRPGVVNEKVRLAILGGYSFYPFRELVEHLLEMERSPCELWVGNFDNYIAEIMEKESELYQFQPQAVLLMPSEKRCSYPGALTDPREMQQAEASRFVDSLIGLARTVHERTHADVLITNFLLPARHDLGIYRSRTLGSDWSFRKWINLELGLNAPPYLHICDLEFLAHRHGGLRARDERGWFESKQPGSPALLFDLGREVAHLLGSLRRAPKKVLVLDLDNTLWGGVVADDGLEGIEIGDTSPRGEAFKAFQHYIASLKARGVLLAVASKNDHDKAAEVFEKHPEMRLRLNDFVAFRANWEPKSDNIRSMAAELNLGLDSFVFVDDNPAEIEIVRQFAPEVATIQLGADPSDYVGQLQDCRLFEPRQITAEDGERTLQYRSEAQRKALAAGAADMDSYLTSLEMEGEIREFTPIDVARIAQLINKSNQFNLTTRRRTEADILALLKDPLFHGFTVRLKDRFCDHGLISVVIARRQGKALEIDTWLMSCRVLKRQVEEEVLNELVRIASTWGCVELHGRYIPTSKNEMVRDHYARLGFGLDNESEQMAEYQLAVEKAEHRPTKIKITRPGTR